MKRLWSLFLVVLILSTTSHLAYATERQQTDAPDPAAEALSLFARMSAAQKVGQLFLVSFEGSEIALDSPVYALITQNYLGGVMITAENNNVVDSPTTAQDLRQLTDTLQGLAITGESPNVITATISFDDESSQEILTDIPAPPTNPPLGLPLFVATEHGGDAHSDIISGLTPLPSHLALGSTWSTEQVQTVGQVAGRELSGVGVNFLIGPSLDILNNPNMVAGNGISTDSFGGNPYWVGQLGQAYVQGVREGSNGRLAIVATGFPGSGGSDRPLIEEIATVRKSFDQLQSSELIPYLEVVEEPGRIDGLMTAHIRYQGFQGNIQANTPPVSFDPQALDSLMGIPEMQEWQQTGGIIVSAPLGVPSVTRYYSPDGSEFPHRLVAKDALLAGNDMLIIDDFGEDAFANLQDTMSWFEERYVTDPAFQARVDEAVLRILELKFKLYGSDFSIEQFSNPELTTIETVGESAGVIYGVAQAAVTLLSPNQTELASRLPSTPTLDDDIVIFTDVRTTVQCDECPVRENIGKTLMGERMISLYGPDASGQVTEEQISSFDFGELELFLDTSLPIILPEATPTVPPATEESPESDQTPVPTPTPEPFVPPVEFLIQEALNSADWIIVALQDVSPEDASAAFNRLLAERPNLIRDKNVVVFAFELPTYLDTTEISQVTAYYNLASPSEPFVDAAVQTVFKDLSPRGALPISVQALGYNLEVVTQPNANQIIELSLFDLEDQPLLQGNEPLGLEPGDTIRLITGEILDQNGNIVPDGTVVQFTQEDRVNGFFDVIGSVLTVNGTAAFDYVLEARPGQFRLRASAGFAETSEEVDIAIEENQEASVVVITPTFEPTATATATLTPTPTETPTPRPTLTATPIPVEPEAPDEPQLNILLSELQMLASMLSGLGILTVLTYRGESPLPRRMRRWLWAVSGGLLGYIYFILELPGLAERLPDWGNWLGLLVTLFFGLIGLLGALLANLIWEDQ